MFHFSKNHSRKALSSLLIYRIIIFVFLAFMLLPLLGTVLYSFSNNWSSGIFPDELTTRWYQLLFSDARFIEALFNSVIICLSSLILTAILVIPVVFVVFTYLPQLKALMNLIIILPFAVPPIVSSVGLIQLYSNDTIQITGTPWILLGAYFTVALPFMYQAMSNSISRLNITDLLDAAHLLGASTSQAFFRIILPNLKVGLTVSFFLCFSLLFGEFVFANILVGTHFETVQVYLFNMKLKSGHFTSAIVVSYFMVVLLMTSLAIRLGGKQ